MKRASYALRQTTFLQEPLYFHWRVVYLPPYPGGNDVWTGERERRQPEENRKGKRLYDRNRRRADVRYLPVGKCIVRAMILPPEEPGRPAGRRGQDLFCRCGTSQGPQKKFSAVGR
jgi:hypothetical protein